MNRTNNLKESLDKAREEYHLVKKQLDEFLKTEEGKKYTELAQLTDSKYKYYAALYDQYRSSITSAVGK